MKKDIFSAYSHTLVPVLAILFVPSIVFGGSVSIPSQIVPNCGVNCGWLELVGLAKNILDFMIYLSVPIAAIAFMYAGWLYLSARGNTGQISKAHGIFLNVVIGLIIVLVAWGVVDLIIDSLLKPGSYVEVLKK